jgi:hypothetical protein
MIEIVNRKNADPITSRSFFSIARAAVTNTNALITDRTECVRRLIITARPFGALRFSRGAAFSCARDQRLTS